MHLPNLYSTSSAGRKLPISSCTSSPQITSFPYLICHAGKDLKNTLALSSHQLHQGIHSQATRMRVLELSGRKSITLQFQLTGYIRVSVLPATRVRICQKSSKKPIAFHFRLPPYFVSCKLLQSTLQAIGGLQTGVIFSKIQGTRLCSQYCFHYPKT